MGFVDEPEFYGTPSKELPMTQGTRDLAIVVLAAGKGTRMKSSTPKVLHKVLGLTVLEWVLRSVSELSGERTIVVTGHDAELVESSLPNTVRFARQLEQRGSGDALAASLSELREFNGDVLVVNGDGALFTQDTLHEVVKQHRACASLATALAIRGDIALPYGRVVRGEENRIVEIIEAVDASKEQLEINELNAGVYCFDADMLRQFIPRLSSNNAKGELYITDLLGIAAADGRRTLGVVAGNSDELIGINDRLDLALVEGVLRRRILEKHMRAGVTISMPETVLIEPDATLEPDCTVLARTTIRGTSHVARGAVVGPDSDLFDTRVSQGARIERSVACEAHIGRDTSVGPFAYLRPGADLRENSKVGTFVEIKNSLIMAQAKVPHLSYIGDATVGERTNIGAGNITANYRPELGRGKQRTVVGADVRTGSDCVLVAPVSIGDGAWTGAGSIVTDDVPAGALALARSRQTNIEGYAERVMNGVQA